MSYYHYQSKVGDLTLQSKDGYLILLAFKKLELEDKYQEDDVIKKTIKQLEEYFNKERTQFDIKIKFENVTDFQEKVYQELLNVKYGQYKSYKEIAVNIGNPKASRAIGNANNKNPIVIIVPCHRIIGSNNQLVGYGGGLDIKQQLLELEDIII